MSSKEHSGLDCDASAPTGGICSHEWAADEAVWDLCLSDLCLLLQPWSRGWAQTPSSGGLGTLHVPERGRMGVGCRYPALLWATRV